MVSSCCFPLTYGNIFLFIYFSGPAKKWSFQPLSLEVHCDRQKDLEKAVKIVVLDKHHNVTSPLEGILPVISVEHAQLVVCVVTRQTIYPQA